MKASETGTVPGGSQAAWKWAGAAVYLALTSSLLLLAFSHWAYDDPFITYRYARNLAEGVGFVYNPGERVLSTTTPLFTLLLAGLSPLGIELPLLANAIGAISMAAGGLLLWQLGQEWNTPLGSWACLALYPTFPLVLITLGSETPLTLALCLGAFLAYLQRRPGLTGLLAGLAALARPDAVLVLAVLGLDSLLGYWRFRRPIPWRTGLVFLLVLAPWVLFAWGYFGSPLPVTLAAKQGQGAMAISERFLPGFATILSWYDSLPYRIEAGLALIGAIYLLAKARPWGLLLAWTLLYFSAYSLLGVSRYFWYYAPLVPGFLALVGLGIEGLAYLIARVSLPAEQGFSLSGMAGLAVLLALTGFQVQSLLATSGQTDPRAVAYPAAGRWLEENTPEGASVGALEVGMIGYYARRPVVDFAGLIQPEVARQMESQTTYQDTAAWAVEHYRPEYLVLQAGVFLNLEQGYAAGRCHEAQRFPGADTGYSTDLVIYDCR